MTASAPRTAAYIGIGSNLGDARDHVEQALTQLSHLPDTRLTAQSSLFRSAPVDAKGDDFINAAACIVTGLAPQELLDQLHAIELAAGRVRTYQNAPRTLDLDILLYGMQTIDTPSLTVPHPRLTQRAFALIPLLQLEPLIDIPGQGAAHQFISRVTGQSIQKI